MSPNSDRSSRTALLLGASGLVGGHCLDLLLGDNRYDRVCVLARRPISTQHPKLDLRIVDFDRLDDHVGLFAVDDLFCCLGTTIATAGSQEAFRRVDYTYPVTAATIASERGARQFLVVSSLGADPSSRIFYNRVKGEMERDVAALEFDGIQIFRPSLLLGDRREFRLGERIAGLTMRLFSFAMIGSLKKYRAIHARDVAAAMIAVAHSQPGGVNIYESDRIAGLARNSG